MPTFVMLTNLTSEGIQTLKNNPSRVQEVNKEVEQLGVQVKQQWATLGQYDFITIVEAPDEKTMAKVSVELGSRGTMSSQTLAALHLDGGSVKVSASGATTLRVVPLTMTSATLDLTDNTLIIQSSGIANTTATRRSTPRNCSAPREVPWRAIAWRADRG